MLFIIWITCAALHDGVRVQAMATERQVFTVRKLRAGVRTGEVDAVTLQKAEAILAVRAVHLHVMC
jgi:hypothetical protein